MNTGTNDRRVRRTHQLLGDALFELVFIKSYDAITVQDIIDRANVGRSTFYAHYRDKEDLLLSQFGRLIDALTEQVGNDGHTSNLLFDSLGLFRHVQEQQGLYKAMVHTRGTDLLFQQGQQYLSTRLEARLGALLSDGQASAAPVAAIAAWLSSALLGLLKWWLDNKMIYTPEQMDEMFRRLVLPGVMAALGHDR